MASTAQIIANQANSAKSTGPKSAEGKDISRRNALKHGLAALSLVLPDEEAAAVAARVEEWTPALKPQDAYDEWLVEQVAASSVQIERCRALDATLRDRQVSRAALCWDEDREADAEELGARLAKSPATVARKLRGTKHGCEWMIGRWEGLSRILEAKGDWDDAQQRLALDLLGTPAELRDGPTRLVEDRFALIREQVGRLATLKAKALVELDDLDRAAAEVGLGTDTDKALTLARRYESACLRRLEWARSQLKANHKADRPEADRPARDAVAEEKQDLARLTRMLDRELPPPPSPSSSIPPLPVAPPTVRVDVAASAPRGENRKARRAREAHARRS